MDKGTCWLMTDSLGEGASNWRWGRGVTHTLWPAAISGYCTESAHLPYLLDPLYERYGSGARLWLSELGDARHEDPVRVSSNTWTTLMEWERPGWVGGPADVRVRLRFALLAAAAAHSVPEIRSHLRSIALDDMGRAAKVVQHISTDGRRRARVPQATSMAAMAVHLAASLTDGHPHPVDLAARRYPVFVWYAGMAAACARASLAPLADEAVRCEVRPPAARHYATEPVRVVVM